MQWTCLCSYLTEYPLTNISTETSEYDENKSVDSLSMASRDRGLSLDDMAAHEDGYMTDSTMFTIHDDDENIGVSRYDYRFICRFGTLGFKHGERTECRSWLNIECRKRAFGIQSTSTFSSFGGLNVFVHHLYIMHLYMAFTKTPPWVCLKWSHIIKRSS